MHRFAGTMAALDARPRLWLHARMRAFAVSVVAVSAFSCAATAQPPEASTWEVAFDDDEIKVHRRFAPDTEVFETLTYATVDAAPAKVFAVLTDHAHYPEFMPHMIESRVLRTQDDAQLIFQRLRFTKAFRFLLKDRYHVVANRVTRRGGDETGFRIEWSLDETATREAEVERAIATQVNTGYWDLTRAPGGTGTQVEYYLRTDPGGAIPSSFANAGTTQSIPDVIRAVRERVKSVDGASEPP